MRSEGGTTVKVGVREETKGEIMMPHSMSMRTLSDPRVGMCSSGRATVAMGGEKEHSVGRDERGRRWRGLRWENFHGCGEDRRERQ